jgi:hypothetical protein
MGLLVTVDATVVIAEVAVWAISSDRGKDITVAYLDRLPALLLIHPTPQNEPSEAEEDGLVDEGVLLLRLGALLELLAGRAHDGLNLVAVDQAGDVGVGALGGGETGGELAIIESNSRRHDIHISFLYRTGLSKVPKTSSRSLNTPSVQMTNQPRCPPSAS